MTQATDTDIREIKSAIDANTKSIDNIARATEANTKAIADLTTSVTGLREEMRVGFSDIRGEIKEVKGQINTLEAKFDERTKGFVARLDGRELIQRNITSGVTVAIVGALLLALARYLFFGAIPTP
jgi:predicted  nucleic acid-binding Zn-ribbon protein